MDGVVADFEKGISSLAPELARFKTHPNKEELSPMIDKICYANTDTYHSLPHIKGAAQAVKELAAYFQIFFLSTPCGHYRSLIQESDYGKRNILAFWGKRN